MVLEELTGTEGLTRPARVVKRGIDNFLDLLQEDWVREELAEAIQRERKLFLSQLGFIPAFTRIAALIGKALPEPFTVRESTLSAELAKREDTNLLGAHLLLMRPLFRDSKTRVIGRIATDLLIGGEPESEVLQGIIQLPKSERLRALKAFRTLQKKRRR